MQSNLRQLIDSFSSISLTEGELNATFLTFLDKSYLADSIDKLSTGDWSMIVDEFDAKIDFFICRVIHECILDPKFSDNLVSRKALDSVLTRYFMCSSVDSWVSLLLDKPVSKDITLKLKFQLTLMLGDYIKSLDAEESCELLIRLIVEHDELSFELVQLLSSSLNRQSFHMIDEKLVHFLLNSENCKNSPVSSLNIAVAPDLIPTCTESMAVASNTSTKLDATNTLENSISKNYSSSFYTNNMLGTVVGLAERVVQYDVMHAVKLLAIVIGDSRNVESSHSHSSILVDLITSIVSNCNYTIQTQDSLIQLLLSSTNSGNSLHNLPIVFDVIISKRMDSSVQMAAVIKFCIDTLQQTNNWKLFHDCCIITAKWLYSSCAVNELEIPRFSAFLCESMSSGNLGKQLPEDIKRSDVHSLLFSLLAEMLSFECLQKQKQDEIIHCLGQGLHRHGQKIGKQCLHILHVALYQFPSSMTRNLPAIVMKLSQITAKAMTSSILEFLSALSQLPDLFVNFTDEDHKRVLGIAVQSLNYHAFLLSSLQQNQQLDSQYLFYTAQKLLTVWLISLKESDRQKFIPFILHFMSLSLRESSAIDVQENFFLVADMLNDEAHVELDQSTQSPESASELYFSYANMLYSFRSDAQLVVRRSLGLYQSNSPHNAQLMAWALQQHPDFLVNSGPKLVYSRTSQEAETLKRAIKILDKIPPVDVSKVAVVFVRKGQSLQTEVLQNICGSLSYTQFINELGTFVRLKGCTRVFTGGLDIVSDTDGLHALYWQESRSQVIFHVATLMPNVDDINKKKHIGNDLVTIVFTENDSYDFDCISSEFNYIQIVIAAKASKFRVWIQCKQGLDAFGPLQEPRTVTQRALGPLVRRLALHAHLYAQISSQNGFYQSNTKERLRQITRISERHGQSIQLDQGQLSDLLDGKITWETFKT